MLSANATHPPFGQADLSNCEREQIHLAASIQPHGALVVVRETDRTVVQASANAAARLGLSAGPLGTRLDTWPGSLWARVQPHFHAPVDALPIAVRCVVGEPGVEFDCLVHHPADGGIVLELEPAGPDVDLTQHVDKSLQVILGASSLRMLCDDTAKLFKALTGYDRVMVYRFDAEGHGQVFAEEREPQFESFLGNWYPASDIPQMARRLYARNRVRVLVDVDYGPVPLSPRLNPLTGRDLDMSMCFLRSMSPLHIKYLSNMGVGATLVASLLVGGKLWGLVACHHHRPREAPFEIRAVCELLAEAVATRIAALESFVQAHAELAVRRLEQRLIEAIGQQGDWRMALFDRAQTVLQPVGATGAALFYDNESLTSGEVPDGLQLRRIIRWLDGRPREPVIATTSLDSDVPDLGSTRAPISGLMAVPLSTMAGEWLMWFRPERIRTVTWGGDPRKPVVIGSDPADLSPRRSFAQWHEVVEGTAEPWTPSDLSTARLIGETLADVSLQFRSVQMLIAKNQLDEVTREVGASDQPVIVADMAGDVLLTNAAFDAHWGGRPTLRRIGDFAQACSAPVDVARNLAAVVERQRPWRGELALSTSEGERAFTVRADPVLSQPDRLLGYVVLLNDLTERRSVETARRDLQVSIIERHRIKTVRLGSHADLMYQNLLAALVENAQVAALEITEGVDLGRMSELLDNVRSSVQRASEVLEHLIRHAAPHSTT